MLNICSQDPERTDIVISGDFDAALASAHREAFENAARTASGPVAVDLGGVSFIDSSGIGAIVYLYKRLKARGVPLLVTGAAGQPLRVIRALRIERTISVNAGAGAR